MNNKFTILIIEPKPPYKKKDGTMSKNAYNFYFQHPDTQSVFTVYKTGEHIHKVGDKVELSMNQFQGSFKYALKD